MNMLLKNAKRLLADNTIEACEIKIKDGIIKEISTELSAEDEKVIDCGGHLLAPGLIDVHIHLREPGGEHKETIKTGTEAAARGGFTTVCAMPNTNPVPDNAETLNNLIEKIKTDASIRVLPYAAITENLSGGGTLTDIKKLTEAGAFAFTDDGVGVQTADMMLRAMQEAAACNKAVVAHCEDNSIVYGGVVHNGEIAERLDLPALPGLSESVQIARDVLLAEAAGCHYHVCHVSTKESVRAIRDAKRAGIHVTAEVTPHHLILNEQDVKTADPNYKMNPPLRAKEDQEALIEGLLDGTIDFIATDHAPHAEKEKAAGFLKAPFGITGLETAFPLLYTHMVQTNKITLKQLIDWMTVKPAEVFGLPYGVMKENTPADLTLLDLTQEKEINKADFLSKGKNTPFDKWKVSGIPVLTIAEGQIAYQEESAVRI